MIMRALFVVFLASALASPVPVTLPGLPSAPTFNSYSGYVQVDPSSQRSLFYFFAEASQVDPASAPVVLWQTGGPGCSSLLAMMSENGPYRIDPENPAKLILDDYSWNRVANVIWLESPAGVGFSFSNNPADYNTNDTRTTEDVYVFLQTFFRDLFPQYANNEFWVTGESYGGHYVPLISSRVISGNNQGQGVKINIKGMQEGNAWTDIFMDNTGAINTWQQRAIVPKIQVDAIKQNCNLSYVGPLKEGRLRDATCDAAISTAMESFTYVNIYDIYVDVCENDPRFKLLKQMAKFSWFHSKIVSAIADRREFRRRSRTTFPPQPPFDACVDNHMTDYFNMLEVQKAINAVPPSAQQPVQWMECSNVVNYDFNSVATSMIPVLRKLFSNAAFHALVYSGDVDAIVPFDGTISWIESLNAPVTNPWHAWMDEYGQVGGFTTTYGPLPGTNAGGFTFSTVRNAGHAVPFYQPFWPIKRCIKVSTGMSVAKLAREAAQRDKQTAKEEATLHKKKSSATKPVPSAQDRNFKNTRQEVGPSTGQTIAPSKPVKTTPAASSQKKSSSFFSSSPKKSSTGSAGGGGGGGARFCAGCGTARGQGMFCSGCGAKF